VQRSPARYLPFHLLLIVFRVASFSLILVVLRVYSLALYSVLLLLLLGIGVRMAAGRDRRFTGVRDYLAFVSAKKGNIYIVTMPLRTILSTGRNLLSSTY
jgi:hypothetical protein